jgi:hypothetical protein
MSFPKTIRYFIISLTIIAFATILFYIVSQDSMDISILYFLSFLFSIGLGISIITLRLVGNIDNYNSFLSHFSNQINIS